MGNSSCQVAFFIIIFSLVIGFCDLCDAKLQIARCCSEHHRIRMSKNNENANDKVCVKVRVNTTVTDFSQVNVYTTSLELTNKTVMDTFEVVNASAMGILINETENFSLAMKNDNNKTIYLTEDAMLYTIQPNEYKRHLKIGSHMFCLGYQPVNAPGVLEVKFFVLPEPAKATTWRDYLQMICPLISTVFLASVLVIYALLEELRKRHGLIFMSYVFNLLIAFLILGILNIFQLVRTNDRQFCTSFILPFYFFMLASFFWMNIMSIDMWRTFSGMVRVGISRRGKLRSDLRKYCVYCVYAWGIPLLMTLAIWRLDQADLTYAPNFIKPNIALHSCFFEDGERFLYLYVPILILLIVNTILFALTLNNMSLGPSAKINRKDTASSRRERYVLYVKLSAVMGINWLLEVIGSFFPEDTMIVADLYNGLIGVIIFFLFVFKKKTFEKLRTRSFASFKRHRHSYSTEATTSVDLGRTSFDHRGPTY